MLTLQVVAMAMAVLPVCFGTTVFISMFIPGNVMESTIAALPKAAASEYNNCFLFYVSCFALRGRQKLGTLNTE